MVVIRLKVPVLLLTRIEDMTPKQSSAVQTTSASPENGSLEPKPVEAEDGFECVPCNRVFKSKGGLGRHVKSHRPELIVTSECHHCHRHFPNKSELQNHINSAHNNAEQKPGTALQCQFCQKTCPTSSALQRHIQTHTKEKYLACKYCDKKFPSLWKLTRHALSLHLNVQQKSSVSHFKYECCGIGFKTTQDLENHQEVHVKPKPVPIFECQVCVKRFSRQGLLDRHIKIHLGEKAFNCEDCKKSFATRFNLNRHAPCCTAVVKVPVPVTDFPCTFPPCTRRFARKENLERHLKTHVLSFKCEYCEKTYGSSSQLVSHTRTHTGEKPFACPTPHCTQRFGRKKSLAVHLKTHARLKACTCSLCDLVCKTEADCLTHEKLHRGQDNRFQCNLCNASFPRKKSLKHHFISHKKARSVFNPFQVLGL